MLQRMGRTGRRGGRREAIIVCVDDDSRWTPSPPGMSIDLVRAVAVADLAVGRGWTEAIRPNPLPFGLLCHQMLAYLKGCDHDIHWKELSETMLSLWPFRNMSSEEVLEEGRYLLKTGLMQRTEDGTLIIGLKGEPIANSKGFAAVFETSTETEVRSGGIAIGTVQKRPKEGAMVSLAGKVWKITRVGDGWADAKEEPEGTADSKWDSIPPEIDDAVMERMREVLASDEEFKWLDSAAKAELQRSRSTFRSEGYDDIVDVGNGYLIFPWLGTRAFEGMVRALKDLDGVEVVTYASPLWIRIATQKTWGMVEQGLRNIVRDSDPEDFVLLEDVEEMGKYEKYVPEGLRAREFAAHRMSFDFVD